MLVRNPRFREWSQAAQPDGYPDRIELRLDVPHGAAVDAVLRGRGGRPCLDGRTRRDGCASSSPSTRPQTHVEPRAERRHAVPQHARAAVRRRARAPGAELRDRPPRRSCARSAAPQPATPTCQILPPNFPGYVRYCPYDAPDLRTARRLVAASGTRGMRVDGVVIRDLCAGRAGCRRAAAPSRLPSRDGGDPDRRDAKAYFERPSDSRSRAQAVTWLVGCRLSRPVQLPRPAAELRSVPARLSRTTPNCAEFCNPAIDARMRSAARAQTENRAARQSPMGRSRPRARRRRPVAAALQPPRRRARCRSAWAATATTRSTARSSTSSGSGKRGGRPGRALTNHVGPPDALTTDAISGTRARPARSRGRCSRLCQEDAAGFALLFSSAVKSRDVV